MFVPLHDDAPLHVIRFQFVTLAIIVGNIIIFVFTGGLGSEQLLENVAATYGLTPADFMGYATGSSFPVLFTFITYMFLHASWLHLITNMLFLWVFADNVEDAFGHTVFAIFYLLCGVVAGAAHVFMDPQSTAPLIGASGAVSGVLGAYVVLYPKSRIVFLITIVPLRLSAIWVLLLWFGLQVYHLIASSGVQVAWWTHVAGFLMGIAIALLLRSIQAVSR